eukprot:gb/GECG01005728.1/.p1 GENE.gb/GECG01005728.1/~~gb/GECG01005728.1/.p1  ORF type:complete len:253 (+),score=41.37 gb/GECG01005728.1/:1-759(+)
MTRAGDTAVNKGNEPDVKDDSSQSLNTSTPMWASPSIQHCLSSTQTDGQESTNGDGEDGQPEYIYSHGLNDGEMNETPTETFDNEGDEELEAILREQFASGNITFSSVNDCAHEQPREIHLETDTATRPDDFEGTKNTNVGEENDSDTIGSDLDDSEIEDALQGPVVTERLRQRNSQETNGGSQQGTHCTPDNEQTRKLNVLVSKAVYSRRKRKHKLTVQLGPGVICIGGVDLIFSRCKLELDTQGNCNMPW